MSAKRRRRQAGFTLPEIMCVVAIIGMLAALALNEFNGSLARAKRSEAIQALVSLNEAQQEYFAVHGQYAGTFDALGWSLEGGERRGPTTYVGGRYTYELSRIGGDPTTWYCLAQGNIDQDSFSDQIEIYDL